MVWVSTSERRGRLEFVFDIQPQLAPGGGWYSQNVESIVSAKVPTEAGSSSATEPDTDKPWVYASGARGLQRFEIPLLGPNDQPASYRVRFHFATKPAADSNAGPVITLQGEKVQPQVSEHGNLADSKLVTYEFAGIPVKDRLIVELQGPSPSELTTVSAVEVERED